MSPQIRKGKVTASKLSGTTIIFLIGAPIVVLLYASYIFNPVHADNIILYIVQAVCDGIAMLVLLSLWLSILLDVIVEGHHRAFTSVEAHTVFSKTPTVDLFITTAGEPIELIEQTLNAALAVRYPHQTFILDDGNSSALRALALQRGAHYIARKSKQFAKSGNLNHGLKFSQAQFFAIFDADQVPKPEFLERTLPYMADPHIAMVQSPQHYSNTDHFIADGTAQAQEIFYKHLCPAKNISNAAFCVGTNVVFRRSSIDQIGGIAQVGHSEDIWTSLLLHEKGWQTIFVNETLAVGKAPETHAGFFKQQLRWSKGGFSMFLLHNPLFSKGLSVDQKLQYLAANFFYFSGFTILAYLLFPILYLLFGVKALRTDSAIEWLAHYLPYVALYYSLTLLLLRRIRVSTLAVAAGSFYPYLLALFSVVFGTRTTWTATSSHSDKLFAMQWVWPHIFIIVLTLFALVIGWYNPINFWATAFNTLWALCNLYLLIVFVTAQYRTIESNV